jgi:p-aminobenzoyl-glutamate transporter AbgT
MVFSDDPAALSPWIDRIVAIGGLILFINLYAKSVDNNVSFGNLFAYGFKATAVFTLVLVAFVVITNLVSPELKEKGFELAREEMLKNKNTNEADVDKLMEGMRKYFWAIAIGGTILGNIILGCIGSLLGAAVTKKNPRPTHSLDQLDA